jgi:hypothetical protein
MLPGRGGYLGLSEGLFFFFHHYAFVFISAVGPNRHRNYLSNFLESQRGILSWLSPNIILSKLLTHAHISLFAQI